ncbi:MAG TPA: GAF domain-containing protein, partial [Blastocatellia bacterium]|nr:GAF domain-containing protein [Blastocatellia bacterium]
ADPRGICERVIQRNVDELGANAGHIRLLDNRTNELLFVAGKGAYRHFAPLKKSLGSDISGKVAATGDLYYGPFLENERHLQRLKADSRLLTRRAESYQAFLAEITSELTLPFRIDNTFYGLVTLYGTEPNHAPTVTASDVDDFFQQALEDLRLSKPIEPHNLGRLIHFTIDLESNVRRQLQHSLDIFHAYTAHIRLYDRNRGELVYLAGRGAVQYFASRRPRKHLGEDVFTEVVVSGKPRFVPNLESDPHFARFQALYRSECESGRIERNPEFEEFLQRAKSELIVPLRIPAPHGDIIGCAAMTSERPGRSFDRKARKDFQDLINQVSGAFAAVTKHTGVAVSDLITFSTNSRHAFREALRSLIARSRPLAKWGHIRIIDADSRQLTLYVCVGPHEHFAAPEVPLEDVPMYRGVIDAGADYRVTDLQRQPHFARMLDDHQARRQNLNEYLAYLDSVRSELVAPLKVEDRMIGTATVQSYRADAFRYAECGFFANSMKYAAVLIENSQLSQSIEQLQTLIKNSASPQLPRLLSHLARSAVELLGADIVAIYEYQSETKSFSLPATIEGVLIRPHLTERSIRADRVPGVMVKTGEPFICPDASLIGAKLGVPELLAGRARSRGFVARERIESAAGFPLTVQEEPVGVMFFNFRNPQSFSESRKQLMRIFASEASIAIRNARLHKKALEKDLRLKGLMGAYDLERDLHQILSQAAEVFAADSGHIRLLDHDSGRLKKVVAVGEQFLRVKEEVEWGEPIAGYLLDQPSPIIVRNAEEGPFQIPQHPDLRHTNPSLYDFLRKVRSYACLPLLESEKVVGTLCLASERIGTFDDSKRKALEEYCEMAVNAVHKSRVYRQALAESAELKDKIDRYYELASLLDEDYGIDKKIALILTAITMRGGLEFNRALLFLKDDNENTLTLRYGIGPRDEMDAKSIYADEIWTDLGEAKSPLRELCERGRLEEFVHRDAGFLGRKGTIAVALKDQTQWLVKALHEHNSVLVRRPDLSSGDVLADIAAREFILTPLGTSADPIGVLYVDNKYTQRSGDLKRDFLQLYADRAKEAIQQARQHRREILNPFIFTHPTTLQDKNVFAGRSDVIRQLEQAFLGTARPPTVLLHGAKRMGKTSILCQLPRLLGPDFAPVTVDCQEPSITDGPATLVKYLSNRIREGLRMRAVQIHTLEPDAKRPYAVFDRWLDTVEARLPERMRVLLCLDEYEMLAAGLTKGWGAQFLDALRHILQH